MKNIHYDIEVVIIFKPMLKQFNFNLYDYTQSNSFWKATFINESVALEIGQEFRVRGLNIDICRLDINGNVPAILADFNVNGELNRINFDYLLEMHKAPKFNLESGHDALRKIGHLYSEYLLKYASEVLSGNIELFNQYAMSCIEIKRQYEKIYKGT